MMDSSVPLLGDLAKKQQAVQLLQRSLDSGRLAHAYLFVGSALGVLEDAARSLASTLNCRQPKRRGASGLPLDGCGACPSCRRIAEDIHPDVQWIRPESKSRIIAIDQVRALMREIHLKSLEADYKMAVLVAADRLNEQAGNAFLKTLEEPPARSVFVLLTGAPEKLRETILSRCLRLNFSDAGTTLFETEQLTWIKAFSDMAAGSQQSWLSRYQLLGILLSNLASRRERIEKNLAAHSPLEKYAEIDSSLRDKWEDELAAAVEAEYRRQRADMLMALQWWLRDIWLITLACEADLLAFPEMARSTRTVAGRLTVEKATANLRIIEQSCRLLDSNVQEALILEVGLLKLAF